MSETSNKENFPHALPGWSQQAAAESAAGEGISVGPDHWEAVRALQEFYARHDDGTTINIRELHDALDEHFHARGGMKFLYRLFPGGPVSQGCRLAGLEAPPGSTDPGFGSVQ